MNDINAVVKTLRRGPLSDVGAPTAHYETADLARLLPQRPPFLLIDEVESVDIANQTIRGRRTLRPDDPVFTGHFPDRPIYPGVLQIEAMAQLGICLATLTALANGDGGAGSPIVVMTKVLHAAFYEPLYPGDQLTLHASVLDSDGLITRTIGQVFKGPALAALAVQEGCNVD